MMNVESLRSEASTAPKDLEQLAVELAEMDPRPVTYFTPDNLSEVRDRFLQGDTEAVQEATYHKLDSLDFNERASQYERIMQEILSHPNIPQNHMHVYQDYIYRNACINELMRQAMLFRTSSGEEKDEARHKFIEINRELYGEPQSDVASAMVQEVLMDTSEIDDAVIKQIRDEFIKLLPEELAYSKQSPNKLKPSEDTKEFMTDFVEYVYGSLLHRVDEFAKNKEYSESAKVDTKDIAEAFQHIIDNEFPDSGWKAELADANAIKVVVSDKKVIVPTDRKPVTMEKLKGLVVHELGVHMLRSIIGEGSDLIPQRLGFAGTGEAEEGLAKVIESTVVGGESRTGYQHYLTATLLNKGYSFSQAFEAMWRYKTLDAYLDKPVDKVDDDYTEKQKRITFNFMFRSVRGTNGLPWHTVLNYFNGTHAQWDYIDTNKESIEMMTLLFLGKIDPTNHKHVRGALDARSKVDA